MKSVRNYVPARTNDQDSDKSGKDYKWKGYTINTKKILNVKDCNPRILFDKLHGRSVIVKIYQRYQR